MNPWDVLSNTVGWILLALVVLVAAVLVYAIIAATVRTVHQSIRRRTDEHTIMSSKE